MSQWHWRLRVTAHAIENLVDAARHRLSAFGATKRPRSICAYHGYATRDRVVLSGRVLAQDSPSALRGNESIWRNLSNTWRRFNTKEVPNVDVTVRFAGQEETVRTDEEGYYHIDMPYTEHEPSMWREAEARCARDDGDISATHSILAPSSEAEFAVISDLDDTVIETNVTSIVTAAKLTFIGNAKTRKPLEGVAALYQSFVKGNAGRPVNPIFYISSSPWNLYDLLCDFMVLNAVPKGPIFLRDIGIDETKFIKRTGHREKLERALQIMADFPHLPFVLVGDSAEHDAGLYAEAATLHPQRIKAIYIRDVDPQTATDRDAHVREHIKTAERHGVPMILAPDSSTIAHHATTLGLIPERREAQVAVEAAKDQQRPEPGVEALREALGR